MVLKNKNEKKNAAEQKFKAKRGEKHISFIFFSAGNDVMQSFGCCTHDI